MLQMEYTFLTSWIMKIGKLYINVLKIYMSDKRANF